MGESSLLLGYIMGVNLIGFIIMGIDKRKAIQHKWRIPERTFWLLSLLGGAIGSLLGMTYFRHKTKHASFKIGMPILVLINIGLFTYLYNGL